MSENLAKEAKWVENNGVYKEISAANYQLEKLFSIIEVLEDKLSPITIPRPTPEWSANLSTKEESSKSKLSESIYGIWNRIHIATEKIARISAELDL